MRTLPDDVLFAYLVSHGTFHHWSRLKWLADIQALLATSGSGAKSTYMASADRLGAGYAAAATCRLIHVLYGGDAGLDRITPRPPSPAAERLANRCQRRMLAPIPQPAGFATIPYTIDVFRAHDSWRYRWHHFRTRWIDWRQMERTPLPPALAPLYPALRFYTWLTAKLRETFAPNRPSAHEASPR